MNTEGNLSYNEFLEERFVFEKSLASLIKRKAEELDADGVHLCHMHNFVIGNDDRDFSRRFIREYFSEFPNITYDRGLSTVDSIIENMKSSRLNICMRFHSVLFAESLKVDFIAIDYTLGGKIYNYLSDANQLDKMLSFEALKSTDHREYLEAKV